MAYSEDLAEHVEHEMDVARGRFRSRIAKLAVASLVLDLAAAGVVLASEHGAPHAFATYLDAQSLATVAIVPASCAAVTISPEVPGTVRAPLSSGETIS